MRNVLFWLLLTLPLSVYAWGPLGQSVTVKVAESFLTKPTLLKVRALTGGRSLSDFASWADGARNTPQWAQSSIWHYINIDKNISDSPQDILQAIAYSERELNSATTNDEKLVWLKFIIHFVGDLHQPLHTGKSADRGGNSTLVNYAGKKTNLHALWDSAMIQTLNLNTDQYFQKLVSMGMSQELLTQKFEPEDVLTENAEILNFVYSYENNTIDQAYAEKAIQASNRRLWAGGMRLASLLNQLLP